MFPSDLKWFTRKEFKHPDKMDEDFLRWLDKVRDRADIPIIITSDYRDPEANLGAAGSSSASLHLQGLAVDFRLPGRARDLWKLAKAVFGLAEESRGSIEFELVHSPRDKHVHLGVDRRMLTPVHELILADD